MFKQFNFMLLLGLIGAAPTTLWAQGKPCKSCPKANEQRAATIHKIQPKQAGTYQRPKKVQNAPASLPSDNSVSSKIQQLEYFKAQYADDPATQAKYQKDIDRLKQSQTSTK